MSDKQAYLGMQTNYYDEFASVWSIHYRDPVVGTYDLHEQWTDYDEYLFKGFDTNGLIALDYGCGPGRSIIHYNNRFTRIDGVDISAINLNKATDNCNANGIDVPLLYHTNGDSLDDIDDDTYDVVYSVICLQHICSHEIRDNIFREAYRVLKPGGKLCFQMGYGGKEYPTASWQDDQFDAASTNGHSDVSITNEQDVIDDLEAIGFGSYLSDIRPTGPGDNHRNWIWIQVTK